MAMLRPQTIGEALELRADHPEASFLAGGTGILPDLNAGRLRPSLIIDLTSIHDWRAVDRAGSALRLSAGVTYTQLLTEVAAEQPLLAQAVRSIASPQLRNRATIAGALAIGDPSGDALAALVACDAQIEMASARRGERRVAAESFVTGFGCSVMAADELITAIHMPIADGPVAYAKVGARNAMARAIAGVALVLDPTRRQVGCGVVGVSATAVRPRDAERRAAARWADGSEGADDFGAAVANAITTPVGDSRASGDYRRHAARILARRAFARAWAELAMRP